jgi:hypothetical protein
LCDFGPDNTLVSRKWEVSLYHIKDIFKYEKEAIERDKFYQLKKYSDSHDKYELWLDYLLEYKIMTGDTVSIETEEVEINDYELLGKLKEKAESIIIEKPIVEKKKRVYSENEDEDDDEAIVEDEDGNILREDEELKLDDEFDDTFSELPDGYVIDDVLYVDTEKLVTINEMDKEIELQKPEEVKKEEQDDEWGF